MGTTKPPEYLYRQVPALLKPPKRSFQRALPSALHIGFTATFSILVFAIINVAVTHSLGPKHKWTSIVHTGTQVRMCAAAPLPTVHTLSLWQPAAGAMHKRRTEQQLAPHNLHCFIVSKSIHCYLIT